MAAALTPCVCMVSCSDPRESAQEEVEDFMEGIAEIVHDSEGDTIEELIHDLHGYVESKAPGIVDDLADLNDGDRRAVLQGVVKSEALRQLVKRVAQAAIARLVDDKELIREGWESFESGSDEKEFAFFDKHLPYETRIEAIEIGLSFAKIGVALGIDKDDANLIVGHALMEVAMEYGVPKKFMKKAGREFGVNVESAPAGDGSVPAPMYH